MYILDNKSYDDCKSEYTKQTFTKGGKIFFSFLLIEYLFPLFLNFTYTFDKPVLYRMPIHSPIILVKILLLIFVSIISLLITRYTPTVILKKKCSIKPLPKWFIVLFSLIAIVAGLMLHINGFVQWRYTTPMSSSPIILFAAILQDIMPILIFWVIITDHQFILSRSMPDMLIKGILLFATISLFNGIGAVFTSILFALFLIAPKYALELLFTNPANEKRILKYIKLLFLLTFILLILITFFLRLGEYAKTGVKHKVTDNLLYAKYFNFDYLLSRHSTHLYALAGSIEDGANIKNLNIIINTFVYRLKLLTGTHHKTNKEEIDSLNKVSLHQFTLHKQTNPREGTSPGLLASFTMTLPFPFAIFATFLATFILVKFLDYILYAQKPFSWIGALIFAYIPIKYFTDSPFDNLPPGPHYFFFLFILLASLRRKKFN
jgi:hypothetical protein